ncbi:MAG: hypothetical protein HYX21_00935 [Candidatus Yanofskybacteria bacterium]|nr:hypothetical protein [Candidatus Yanofskybacteria bacterium]
MGYRTYSDEDLLKTKKTIKDSGKDTFARTADIRQGRTSAVCHEKLSIAEEFRRNRESRDSDAHPQSNALALWFDVTGSLLNVPKELEPNLKDLMGYLLEKNYLPDVAVMFSAVGDSTCDRVPFQVGQFESGAQELMNFFQRVYLEGGGGGQNTESYQNALYYMARHTQIDCFEKRGKKGYFIMFGDELPYNNVRASEIKDLMGGFGPDENIPLKKIIEEANKKYVVIYIIPRETNNGRDPEIWSTWRGLLGEEFVMGMEKTSQICELIGTIVGVCEGKVSPQEAVENLKKKGVGKEYLEISQNAFVKLYGINKDKKGDTVTSFVTKAKDKEPKKDKKGGGLKV